MHALTFSETFWFFMKLQTDGILYPFSGRTTFQKRKLSHIFMVLTWIKHWWKRETQLPQAIKIDSRKFIDKTNQLFTTKYQMCYISKLGQG